MYRNAALTEAQKANALAGIVVRRVRSDRHVGPAASARIYAVLCGRDPAVLQADRE